MFKRMKAILKTALTAMRVSHETSRRVWADAEKERETMHGLMDVSTVSSSPPHKGEDGLHNWEQSHNPPFKGVDGDEYEFEAFDIVEPKDKFAREHNAPFPSDEFEPFDIEPAERKHTDMVDAAVDTGMLASDTRPSKHHIEGIRRGHITPEDSLMARLGMPQEDEASDDSWAERAKDKASQEELKEKYVKVDAMFAKAFKGPRPMPEIDECVPSVDKAAQEEFANASEKLIHSLETLGELLREAELDEHENWHNGRDGMHNE